MSPDSTSKKYQEAESRAIEILRKQIDLCEDMAKTIEGLNPSRMTQYRKICLAYFKICVDNLNAALLLIENNLIHQICPLNRNTLEMIINIYYIRNDKNKEPALAKRFYDYILILTKKDYDMMIKYPDVFSKITARINKANLDAECDKFKSDYGVKGRQLSTWSGLDLYRMIDNLNAPDLRKQIHKLYDMIITKDNQFIHPTIAYVISVLGKRKEAVTHLYRLHSVEVLVNLISMITHLYFEDFRKRRPEFKEKEQEINDLVGALNKYKKSHNMS